MVKFGHRDALLLNRNIYMNTNYFVVYSNIKMCVSYINISYYNMHVCLISAQYWPTYIALVQYEGYNRASLLCDIFPQYIIGT